ncbi:MAG TPA: cobalt ABC transporter permease, partial [Enterobacteriaceae bacterium]|nr:cobalt ABC transporter permease [Enterobacteriaceae bacterium]
MHPFTSLTLWGLAAFSTLLIPAGAALTAWSTAAFASLLFFHATRRRARYVGWLMFSLG